ncbi:phage terminase small subunit [Streptomyces cyaneochromogenes]
MITTANSPALSSRRASSRATKGGTTTAPWWHTWRISPMAAMFLETDWTFLLNATLMHHTAWRKGKWEFLSEVPCAPRSSTPRNTARPR